MAIDIAATCAIADDTAGGASALAVGLSVTFLVYVGSSIVLSAMTILTAQPRMRPVARRVAAVAANRLDVSLLRARASGAGPT